MGVEEFEFGGVNLRGLIWRTLLAGYHRNSAAISFLTQTNLTIRLDN